MDTLAELPPELLTLSDEDLVDYHVSLSFMRTALENNHSNLSHSYKGKSPLFLLRQVLAKCADEVPSPGTTALAFIPDRDLRESIRQDISAAGQDLSNGEWKGATVLAGSATEALLLWAVQDEETKRGPGALRAAAKQLVTSKALPKVPASDPENWVLSELIEVALHLGRIKKRPADQARLAKDFRNLIHPGRVARLGERCDRGTAHAALAAVEFVARDLTP